MWLQLIDQHGLGIFLSLLKEGIECRDLLSVGYRDILEFGIRVLLNELAVNLAVMIYYQLSVRCHIHIKFAAPETVLLSASECRNGVLCITCLIAVPESSVSNDSHSGVTARLLGPCICAYRNECAA